MGIIANQPQVMAGCLDVDAADKACRFIRCCDAFNIPLLTIADVPGYLPGSDQEWRGIIRHGAKLLWCYSEATVPKLTLVTRKDYGGSYLAMCSRDLGADLVLAWPTAEIAVMGASGAANVIFRKEIKEAADPVAKRAEIIAHYENLLYNPYIAASRGFVDQVIAPRETRPKLIAALYGPGVQAGNPAGQEARQHPGVSWPVASTQLPEKPFDCWSTLNFEP